MQILQEILKASCWLMVTIWKGCLSYRFKELCFSKQNFKKKIHLRSCKRYELGWQWDRILFLATLVIIIWFLHPVQTLVIEAVWSSLSTVTCSQHFSSAPNTLHPKVCKCLRKVISLVSSLSLPWILPTRTHCNIPLYLILCPWQNSLLFCFKSCLFTPISLRISSFDIFLSSSLFYILW